MDPELIKKALDLLESGDSAGALELLKQMIASAAGGGPDPAAEEPMSEAADPAAPAQEDPAAARAALAMLTDLTGRSSAGEAITWLRERFAQLDSIASDRAALELSSRRELVGELVKLGVELPSTAWEGDSKDRKPCKRLSDEPLADLRGRVELLRKSRPAAGRTEQEPPAAGGEELRPLTAREVAYCAREKITHDEFRKRLAAAVRRI